MVDAVSNLVTIITSTFTNFLTGIGSSVSDFFTNIFLVNTAAEGATPVYQLSTLAVVSFTMLGVSLAIGLTTLIVSWVRKRKVA